MAQCGSMWSAGGSQNGSHSDDFQTVADCPWDTIAMVKTDTVAGEVTSLESKQDETTDIFENIKLLDDRVRKPLEGQAPAASESR